MKLPGIPHYATNNAHMFYLVLNHNNHRTLIIEKLKEREIQGVFHYLSLHKSQYYRSRYVGEELLRSELYSEKLLRLPVYYELDQEDVVRIVESINEITYEISGLS
jgi:dTDP-4-amino-4,6-dideoxygalactose transaminase